jgi:hypothetical protein
VQTSVTPAQHQRQQGHVVSIEVDAADEPPASVRRRPFADVTNITDSQCAAEALVTLAGAQQVTLAGVQPGAGAHQHAATTDQGRRVSATSAVVMSDGTIRCICALLYC